MSTESQPDLIAGLPPAKEPCGIKGKGVPKGYAARPGSGPEGETCKTCEFKYRTGRTRKGFWKCLKVKHKWSRCYASDIRLKSPACKFWEQALSKTPRLR